MASDPRDTPAMRQYARFKKRHPECVLMFRMGDFYEMFDDDAVRVSKAIGLTLTQRTAGVPMAGVPYHQLETYLRRLIAAGFRVAVCDQLQDAEEAAKAGNKVLDRAVTRVITPGTLVDESLLESGAANNLGAVALHDDRATLAVVEVSTGTFTVIECASSALVDELARRAVHELLFSDEGGGEAPGPVRAAAGALGIPATPRPAWQFRQREAHDALLEQYAVASLAGFGFSERDHSIGAAGAIVRYLRETQATDRADAPAASSRDGDRQGPARGVLTHLRAPRREDPSGTLILDAVSLRSLEVERTIRGGAAPATNGSRPDSTDGSLIGLFMTGPGACRTAAGKRLAREWLCRPSLDLPTIRARHGCVAVLAEDRRTAAALAETLDGVQDIARIAARVALGRATPRDVVALGRSLAQLGPLAALLDPAPAFRAHAARLAQARPALEPLTARIARECVDAPPPHLREGGLFKDGVDAELDVARLLRRDASAWLSEYQKQLIAEHKLPNLRVGYNQVFGYYIELPAAQARQAPAAFARRQTLRNAERYVTPELKDFEEKVTTAEARALEREKALFESLCTASAACLDAIQSFASIAAELDVLGAFADRASRRGWVRPEMTEAPVLRIRQGRHPVLESILGENFVPNDADLGASESATPDAAPSASPPESDSAAAESVPALALITGPNMAGKSTFIRQTALIVLLAHAGSFVPAQSATIGLTDRIFTRVGADDALHAGQSTFMVEMTETANILHNATPRSLIILDEIGRGTGTLDGLSLAWAIAEHLASPPPDSPAAGARGSGREPLMKPLDSGAPPAASPRGPRTLFATHYHELTALEDQLAGRVRNLNVAVREWPPGDPHAQIVFLHRILPGRTDKSYGVQVARLAGVPRKVIERAREVLDSLAVHQSAPGSAPPESPRPHPENGQLSLFTEYLAHPAVDALREIKLDALTPLQAFDELRRLKSSLDEK